MATAKRGDKKPRDIISLASRIVEEATADRDSTGAGESGQDQQRKGQGETFPKGQSQNL